MSADPTQRRIMLALPFVFAVFIVNFPAGLIVYWITTNVWTVGQQLMVKKLYPKPEPRRRRPTARSQGAGARQATAKGRRGRDQPKAPVPAQARSPAATAPRASPRPTRARRRSAQAAGAERGGPGCLHRGAQDLVAEASGASLGEAKWSAMKELEPRFPGVTAECVSFEVVEEAGEGEPVRVRAEVDPDAWREAAEEIPAEPRSASAPIVSRTVHSLGLLRRSTSRRRATRSART